METGSSIGISISINNDDTSNNNNDDNNNNNNNIKTMFQGDKRIKTLQYNFSFISSNAYCQIEERKRQAFVFFSFDC